MTFLHSNSCLQPTTDDTNCPPESFRIVHPFHPRFGLEFEIVFRRRGWSENRVYFSDGGGRVRAVPEGWTDLVAADPFVVIGAGRSPFRVCDLLELANLLKELRS